MKLYGFTNCVVEIPLHTGRVYQDPFNEIVLDAVITGPDASERRVPGFWAGENQWRLRYSSALPGLHHVRTVCSDGSDTDLHGREYQIELAPYEGSNPLYLHGGLRISDDRRTLEHADGTPFFWLGDTWWLGLSKRLEWPDEFRELAADRVAKGFSVIQMVAGVYPDMPYGDPRGENEVGMPWDIDYRSINPDYFNMADMRIAALANSGLLPCVVGAWAYHLKWMGVQKMKDHWRNLVARWGAYPTVWCLAGEGAMPYYLSETREDDIRMQREGWTEIGRYVREIDPFARPVTIHPTNIGRDQVTDDSVLDLNMLQTGHGDRDSIPNTIRSIVNSYDREPTMPAFNSEVCYEGIMGASGAQIQRFMFYTCMLSGACGHTYGANGIWQFNREGDPYGDSPSGWSWGGDPWNVCMRYPGSAQMGLGRGLFERYEWWRMRPCPDRVKPRWSEDNYRAAYAAEIPGQALICYVPHGWPVTVNGLGEQPYTAYYFDPVTGEQVDIAQVAPAVDGVWEAPKPPSRQDWVLVVAEARSKAAT